MKKTSFSIKNINQGSFHQIRQNLVIITDDDASSRPNIAKVTTNDMVSWLENGCVDDLMDKVNFFTYKQPTMFLDNQMETSNLTQCNLNEENISYGQIQMDSSNIHESIQFPNKTNLSNFELNQTNLQSNDKQISIDNTIECPICLRDLNQIKTSKENIFAAKCGHIYCETCLTNILARKNCSICRTKLSKHNTIKLFI